MRILPRIPLYSAAVALATAGTVLLATTPAHAELPVMSGDDIKPCTTASGEKDPLTAKDWAGDFIGLEEAHQVNKGSFKGTDEPVTIAIIDSGVEATLDEVFGDRVLEGWDVYDPAHQGECDGYFHGTGVAAIAAGNIIGEQFVGVAPEALILPYRAFVGEEGADFQKSDFVAAMVDDAVAKGANVINISIALPHTESLERSIKDAVAANVVIVAATGNQTLNMDAGDLPVDKAGYYPANYPEVIAVGAHNRDGNWYNKTNFGENLDLVAPGDGVVIPYPGGGWLSQQHGTSFAAPYVAGAAALLKAQFGADITPSWVEHRLKETAIHPTNGTSIYLGEGVLNVAGAISKPLGDEDPTQVYVAPEPDEAQGPDVPAVEPSSIAAMDIDYDPLAFEKTIAWASVGGSILLVTLVLVLRKLIPKGRKRGWRPGTRKPDSLPAKLASD